MRSISRRQLITQIPTQHSDALIILRAFPCVHASRRNLYIGIYVYKRLNKPRKRERERDRVSAANKRTKCSLTSEENQKLRENITSDSPEN
ncbi:hypothetical protein PUN28_018482 [Cardiocondyla obscurior]|uniref:Uncharacterized protein n=1 Tax=Cardiocondyla obscurior TaxID=286306 RepID=A0AAW2EG26_9HYME